MDPFDKVRLAYLRAQLARGRLEKLALAREIQSRSTAVFKKTILSRRYAVVDAEMRTIASELEQFIATTRYALAARKSS